MTKLVNDVPLIRGDWVLSVKYEDVRRCEGQTSWFLPDDYIQRLEHPWQLRLPSVLQQREQ
jgi:hypothetical protein